MKKNLIFSFFSIGFTALTGVLSVVYISRELSKEQFGYFSALFMILSLTTMLDGLKPIVVYKSSLKKNKELNDLLILTIIFALLGSVCCFFYTIFFIEEISMIDNVIISFSVLISILLSFFWGVLEGRNKVGITMLLRSIIYGVIYIFISFSVWLGVGVDYFSIIILSNLLILLLVFFKMSIKYYQINFSFDFNRLKKTLLLSKENFIFNIIVSIMYSFERTILTKVHGIKSLGIYSSQYELSTRGNLLAGTISNVIYPFFSKKETKTIDDFNLWRDISIIFIFIVFVFSIGLSLFSENIIHIYLGQSYVDWHILFKILSLGLFMNSFGYFSITYHRSNGNFKTYTYYYLASFILALLFSYYLISKYGIYGAGYTYLLIRLSDIFIFIDILLKKKDFSSLFWSVVLLLILVNATITIENILLNILSFILVFIFIFFYRKSIEKVLIFFRG